MAVYILHLNIPLHHAGHYTGYSKNQRTLEARIEHHRAGTANSKFTSALHALGIGFTVARVWPDADGRFERQLKNTHNVAKYCPLCTPHPRDYSPKG